MSAGLEPAVLAHEFQVGEGRVRRVFVDGVEQVDGLDYSVSPGQIRFERAVVAQEGFTPLGHVMNALWMTVYPAGVEITVELERDGRVEVVTAQPVG